MMQQQSTQSENKTILASGTKVAKFIAKQEGEGEKSNNISKG
jgi:hypothetical protein